MSLSLYLTSSEGRGFTLYRIKEQTNTEVLNQLYHLINNEEPSSREEELQSITSNQASFFNAPLSTEEPIPTDATDLRESTIISLSLVSSQAISHAS